MKGDCNPKYDPANGAEDVLCGESKGDILSSTTASIIKKSKIFSSILRNQESKYI